MSRRGQIRSTNSENWKWKVYNNHVSRAVSETDHQKLKLTRRNWKLCNWSNLWNWTAETETEQQKHNWNSRSEPKGFRNCISRALSRTEHRKLKLKDLEQSGKQNNVHNWTAKLWLKCRDQTERCWTICVSRVVPEYLTEQQRLQLKQQKVQQKGLEQLQSSLQNSTAEADTESFLLIVWAEQYLFWMAEMET
jgi:hypothetical protein